MTADISSVDRSSYYSAALRLLQFVEARAPSNRRFGPDANALWKSFAGGLKTSDRIDIMLRDADAAWPGAFSARATFGLRAVAEDDAFGADWASLEPMDGEKVWRALTKQDPPTTSDAAIEVLEAAWKAKLGKAELPKLTPTTKILVGGRSAIAAAIRAFAKNTSLSWSDQVIVVADDPSERQLAAAAAAILNITKATVLRASDERDEKGLRGFQAVLSSDASDDVRAAIEGLSA